MKEEETEQLKEIKPIDWKFPSPAMSYFPDGYIPRPAQIYAVDEIDKAFAAGKRVAVLEAPTGMGKSAVQKCFANAIRAVSGKTHLITSQRLLQVQYLRDWPAPEIEPLQGRSNYPCTHPEAEEGLDAANGVCRRRKKGILRDCLTEGGVPDAVALKLPASCHKCPYWAQLQKCTDNSISLFNFSSFLFQQRIGRFGKRDLMIIDEAHGVEAQLMSFVSCELTEWALSILNIKIDRDLKSKEDVVNFLRDKQVMEKIAARLDKKPGRNPEDLSEDLSRAENEALEELQAKIQTFLEFLDMTDWHVMVEEYPWRDETRRKIKCRPYYASKFANALLFSKADRILCVSATILNIEVWARNLGLSLDEVAFVQTRCDFPVENRPIYLEFCGNMGRKWFSPKENPDNPTQPKFVEKVTRILKRHEGQRGIIHCHSFELSKVLRNEVASPRFLFQDQFEDKDAMLAEHAKRTDSVIVAPAMTEGLDLKDDLGRFAIIAKVPWASLGDPIVKERANRDPDWYAWNTALRWVQAAGRTIRSKTDWSYTYLLDQGFDQFLSRYRKMVPTWVLEAMRRYAPKEVRRT